MNKIEQTVKRLDRIQQGNRYTGFLVAVIKRFGDDKGGYLGALITYYGFLSLFPLLLVVTSILNILASGNDSLKEKIFINASSYLPVLGEQLQANIDGTARSGIALAIGLIFALLGARGGADAFRYAINSLWHTPKKQLKSFPFNMLSSFGLIAVGGTGLILSAALATYAAGLGRFIIFQVLSLLISAALLTITFYLMFWISLSKSSVNRRDLLLGAVLSGIGILILQLLGGYLVANQLQNFSSLYGTFALVLGLLFWIFLQVKVVLFAVQINVIYKYKLWPVSITDDKSNNDF